ncbi:MAG: GAF domain-containing sensor histidine kinase [Proteobacteria bacterium]|nr:GAF domain-containing sensor histidine kinase [Pseudomonadota bacterium]
MSEVGDSAVGQLRDQLAREKGKLRALRDIGLALGSTLDLDQLLGVLLARVASVMDSERALLYVLEDDGSELWCKVGDDGAMRESRLKSGAGLAGWVSAQGRALNVKDARRDPRFSTDLDPVAQLDPRSVLGVPMRNHHGRVIGVLQVINKHQGYFGVEDEAMLAALAAPAAVVIENSKLFVSVVGKNIELLETQEQLERKVKELELLFELAQLSATATELDELLDGVLARTTAAMDAEAAAIMLVDARTGDMRFSHARGGDPERVLRLRLPAGEGIGGWVARYGSPLVVNDVDKEERHSRSIADEVGYHPRSVLCVPLQLPEGGAIELLNKSQGEGRFSADDLKLATAVAGHVSTAIQLARSRRSRQQQERLSTIGQLLSSVLHDLKTPMTVISGYARFVGQEPDADKLKKYGEAILRQVEIINAMTGEILAFASGDSQLWLRKVYVVQYFEELLEQLRIELDGRGVEVALELRYRGVARFDQHKIQRAVHNLARNAAQALGAGGGKFTIRVDRRPEDGALVLTFSDDGPGVAPEIRDRMFESFTSFGASGGTGLGLAIVRKVVEDHGGEIELESRPGETVFTITLPQQQQATQPDRGPEADGVDPTASV